MCCVDQPHAREIPELLAHQSESVCAIRTSASTRSLPVSWGRPLRPVAFQNRRVNQATCQICPFFAVDFPDSNSCKVPAELGPHQGENCASYVIYVIVCLRRDANTPQVKECWKEGGSQRIVKKLALDYQSSCQMLHFVSGSKNHGTLQFGELIKYTRWCPPVLS